ncbi:sulfotransferase family protein [Roseobacter sp. YSTF-M11]|uniref:Sulfotransferase family protein n=1 Tax=Roseobacter insulae TaxID=2859783 RepID=A0A9X1FUE2_9RHOB|nr:sulfotransferase [Roseobacter insulae]MBW4707979.1 sulfotransferase family protein [Roseobacter insulae]
MSLLVVNLGLPKSGTTTLARALRRAGYKVADHRIRQGQSANDAHKGKFVGAMMYRGYFNTGDPGAEFDDFDAVTEVNLIQRGRSLWPQTDFGLLDALRKHHPEVRFLASSRDPAELSASMAAWTNLGSHRLPRAAIPGLPAGYGETDAERIKWIEGHYAHLRAIFANDPVFLEFDVAEEAAPKKIAKHLGRPLPWWGRANANAKRKAG